MSETIPAGQTAWAVTGVLERRLLAWLIDGLIVSVLAAVLCAVLALLGIVTLGLGWALFALIPLVPFAYSFGFLASSGATPGQSLMGLRVVQHETGRAPTLFEAFVSTALYVIFLTAVAPILLLALITPRNRAPQDVLSGLLMIRTAPLTDSHGVWNIRGRSPTA